MLTIATYTQVQHIHWLGANYNQCVVLIVDAGWLAASTIDPPQVKRLWFQQKNRREATHSLLEWSVVNSTWVVDWIISDYHVILELYLFRSITSQLGMHPLPYMHFIVFRCPHSNMVLIWCWHHTNSQVLYSAFTLAKIGIGLCRFVPMCMYSSLYVQGAYLPPAAKWSLIPLCMSCIYILYTWVMDGDIAIARWSIIVHMQANTL